MAKRHLPIPSGSPSPRSKHVAPLHQQLYVELRQRLLDGLEDAEQPLPSESALSERFGISRVTVRRALGRLEEEGLIRRRKGIGSFPTQRTHAPQRTNISGLIENLITLEENTTVRNLAWSTVPMPRELAGVLGDIAPVLRVLRVRSYQEQPISLTTIHVPATFAKRLVKSDVGHEPIVRALDRLGIQSATAEQVITAVPAGELAQKHLRVALHSPLICMRRLMFNKEHQPVLHQESLYAPERFEYRMTLTRTSLGPVAKWAPIA